MKSCKEIALEWGLSERTINSLCSKGRIEGAYKEGKAWRIPDDAQRPRDARFSDAVKQEEKKKPLPIGISDYVRAQKDYAYVDKTLLIKKIIDQKPFVTLFTRPRRFGKTLNMDMLRVFFEKSNEDTSIYFKNKAIWKCGEAYRSLQGQYPVIFLSFKDVKYSSWEATLEKIGSLLQEEYGRHSEILSSEKVADYEKAFFRKVMEGKAGFVELTSALEKLSRMLTQHHGKAPVIIIDEYDTPIQEGWAQDFYEEIISFMRNFFSGAFKDNKYLSFGFLTGILRISQESIFSDLNNLTIDSVMDDSFAPFFGFTEEEVRNLLSYYGCSEKEGEVREWYDGYLFGKERIYNPWSVINYISRGCTPQAYWANAGRNEILEDILKNDDPDIKERLCSLLEGKSTMARIDQNTVYDRLSNNPGSVYSLLLYAGYLKAGKKELQWDGTFLSEVSIPNREIASVFKNEIIERMEKDGAISASVADRIMEGLYKNDSATIQKALSEYLERSASFFDGGTEGFYHGLLLGLISLLDKDYRIRSNRESGDGRFDIALTPKRKGLPGIILELKKKSSATPEELGNLAEMALNQIVEKNYSSSLLEEGVEDVLKYGLAFSGKKVVVVSN